MTSNDLSEYSDWEEWDSDAVRKAPNLSGVYVFRLAEGFGRLRGRSDLVYVGCTTSTDGTIQRRLSDHWRAGRFRDVQKVGKLEVCWKKLTTAEEASKEEAKLLRTYVSDHIELPPINRKEEDVDTRKKIEVLVEYIQADEKFKCQSEKDARELAEKLVEYVEANRAQRQTEREMDG
jgi:hypothetical protein